MKFQAAQISLSGTSYMGSLEASYDQLARIFGEPNSEGDGDKTVFEWHVVDDNGRPAALYVYKWGPAALQLCKQRGLLRWNIGATNELVATDLEAFVKAALVTAQ